jgi:hypothetical protein
VTLGPGEYDPTPDERSMAMWAHIGTALVNWLGGWGIIVAIVIYFAKKESKFVAFHALQELLLQIFVFFAVVICVITGIFCCFPFVFIPLVIIGGTIYAIIVGLKANEGRWEEYMLVGAYAKRTTLGAPPTSPGASPPA